MASARSRCSATAAVAGQDQAEHAGGRVGRVAPRRTVLVGESPAMRRLQAAIDKLTNLRRLLKRYEIQSESYRANWR